MIRRPLVPLGVVLALLLISVAPAAAQTLPPWVSSQPLWSWFQIPNTALSVNAPPVPSDPNLGNPQNKIVDWTGAALKRSGSCYMLGAAGGHHDYAGNEVDQICLNTANPQWVQLRGQTPYSQAYGGLTTSTLDTPEFGGDLRPVSTHTYWNTHFVDSINRMLVVATYGLGTCTSAAGPWQCPPANWPYNGSARSFSFNVATNDWDPPDFIAHWPDGENGDPTGAFSAQNAMTGEIYHSKRGSVFAKWTPSSTGGSWTVIQGGNANPSGNDFVGAAVDFDHNLIWMCCGNLPRRSIDFTGNVAGPAINGPAASQIAGVDGGYPGVVYDEANKKVLFFQNVGGPPGGTIVVSRIDPVTGFADFPVTGTQAPARINGLQNAVQYVPELGGVVVTTANSGSSDGSIGPTGYNQSVWFMRTSPAGQVIQPKLTVTVNGSGSVTSNVGGINCPAGSCSASYAPGTPVTLTATTTGFTGWGGACAGTQTTCNLTINVDTTVTANFAATTAALTVTKAGTGTGTVTSAPAGITCGATCLFSFPIGQSVVLTESPSTGIFTSWTGCDSTTATTCTVAMNAPRTVTATFTVATGGNSYSTTFPTVENPLCEGSPAGQNCKWINGAVSGSGFQNMRVVAGSPNVATGATANLTNFDDEVAVLNPATTGAWGPNQFVRTQIRCHVAGCEATVAEEKEIHLNMTCTSAGCAGYEILNCEQIVRWYGPVGSFDGDGTHPVLADTCTGSHCGEFFQDGDIFSAQHVNGVISVFRNGNLCNQANDNTFTNGTPGIGYFTRDASVPTFGFTSFSASDQSMPGGDTTPPSAPSNLVATATSSTTISLTWTASTDNITSQAFINYFVERCQNAGCTNFVQIAGPLTGVTTFVSGSLAPSTTYLHRVRAQDQAGNFSLTYSNNAIATTPAAGNADADFAARCDGAPQDGSGPGTGSKGVLRCFGFDDLSPYPRHNPGPPGAGFEDWGYDFGLMSGGFGTSGTPTLDTSQKTSGAGSMNMHFAVGAFQNDAGSWFTHWGVNKSYQLAENDPREVWVQFRVQWSSALFVASNWPGSAGFKILDMGLADLVPNPPTPPSAFCATGTRCSGNTCSSTPSSCDNPTSCAATNTDFIMQEVNIDNPTIQSYANCNGGHFPYTGIRGISQPGSFFVIQNGDNCQNPSFTVPPCIKADASGWWTIKMHFKLGTFNSFSSVIQIWMTPPGGTRQIIIDCSPTSGISTSPVKCADPSTNYTTPITGMWIDMQDPGPPGADLHGPWKMGKLWLHPYQTGLLPQNGTGAQAPADVWYDELIISTQDIADPTAGTTPPPPSPPTNFHFIP